ncbi:MAG TPA: type III-B CRISPR module RAMP protein Cmr4 [Blastocatellia bacterium]|nr:type III-B CRISPR module RAMP protein Cmr4 [Blastocatellia bacterium]
MFKKATLMFLYTETSLHAGSGTSLGVVDLPIQREKYTDFPVIQASGLKGAVREWFEFRSTDSADRRKIELAFGPDKIGSEESGFAAAVSFTDARILLFPVRSLKGIFAYCTSPTALERFRRDAQIAGVSIDWTIPRPPDDRTVLGVREGCDVAADDQVLLEEYAFGFQGKEEVTSIAKWLSQEAFPDRGEYAFWREKVKKSLLVLPDNAFRDFVKLSTEVQARIKIDNDKRTVVKGGLFYEEALLPDSLLYSVVLAHDPVKDDRAELADSPAVLAFLRGIDGQRLQLGGDATIGRGIVSVRFHGQGKQPKPGKEEQGNG